MAIQSIEKVQRCAVRYVSNNYCTYISVTQLLQSLGWAFLERHHINARLLMFYKMINQQIIMPYNSYLQYSNISFTREPNWFTPFHCHKNTFQSSFFTCAVPKWNKLPANSLSLNQFRLYLLNNIIQSSVEILYTCTQNTLIKQSFSIWEVPDKREPDNQGSTVLSCIII